MRAAVLGVGQTRHRAKRTDVSIAGLCREAADRALADAGLTFADIDAVVVGKAPDLFEGVMMPELYLADALGAVGKPLLRVHTAGSVGGATGIVTANLVQAGLHRRVLAVAFDARRPTQERGFIHAGRGADSSLIEVLDGRSRCGQRVARSRPRDGHGAQRARAPQDVARGPRPAARRRHERTA